MQTDQLRTFVSAFVILDVLAVYAYCLGVNGMYPPSHPWSGVALILLSAGLVGSRRSAELPAWLILFIAVLSAGAWTLAAIRYP
jgi:hypothetical protein